MEGLEYTQKAREMLMGAIGSEQKNVNRAPIYIKVLLALWKRQQLICLYTLIKLLTIKRLAFCIPTLLR